MNRILFVFFCTVCSDLLLEAKPQSPTPVDYVSTLVGTQSKHSFSTGNTYPAIAMPWGMNFWTPQTGKMGNGWVYTYDADKIRGFKQTHQPSPWINDYGQFAIMPVTGTLKVDEDSRASWFSHKTEVAKPHYYSVFLADHDVTTEITPTSRAAVFRFTFPDADSSFVIVDAFDMGSYVKIIPGENKIIGYTTKHLRGVPKNFKNYFVIEFDKPFTYMASVSGREIREGELEVSAKHAMGVVGFQTVKGEKVHARVASSFISFEQAELNLKEVDGKTFEQVKEQGRDEWNDVLGRIEIEDGNVDKLRTFYSCLFRSTLFPRTLYEYDAEGNIVHYSPYNGEVLPGYMFADTGFWDTFRALFPLLNLVYPSMNLKMQEWLVNAAKESGFLPEWSSPGHRPNMIGNNSASVVADAYVKGLRGYDTETLWKAMLNATENQLEGTASGRVGHKYYNAMGYIPDNAADVDRSVSRTLEYAYNDWTIYRFGKAIGKSDAELDIFKKRAMNYRNVYDPARKLMVGRDDKGVFDPDFAPENWSRDFTEGNSWHWSFCVFHDPQGLIDLMGGREEFNSMLDSVFVIPGNYGMASRSMIHEMREMQVMNMGQYAHGNQPIQHMVYMYNYSGEPWKAQYWAREIMDKLYNPDPDGYCGDEDNGQTSAWYVFSAMGFYPVCPGSDEYVLGSPLFDRMRVKLENGKTVEINAKDNGPENRYVSSMKVKGKSYGKNYLTHEQLMSGVRIDYKMSGEPNKQRGTDPDAYPYSFSNEN